MYFHFPSNVKKKFYVHLHVPYISHSKQIDKLNKYMGNMPSMEEHQTVEMQVFDLIC